MKKEIELTGIGVEVITYNRLGYRKEILQFNSVNEAATYWNNSTDEVLPTIWKNGKRLLGY